MTPTRFDAIHALLLAPFVVLLIVAAVLAVAYVSGAVDRLIDWIVPPYRLDLGRIDSEGEK